MKEEIEKVLDVIRPYLQRDGGDVMFVRYEDGFAYLRMLGACAMCQGLDDTVYGGIESVLIEQVPGVIGVRLIEEIE